eukprot:TRINITY_DN940_c0_g1_i7.p1 TRINITY_DN940_c0_g1~~TRINITY_DN940_c0_g1_i7.p1  ORF type:complete len:637 (-),score=280.96 TRINITY_DN940_c0_g1_i7:823-2733(-)
MHKMNRAFHSQSTLPLPTLLPPSIPTNADRKQVLLHHPDKQRQQSETTKPEPEDNELANKAEQTAEGDDDEDPQVKLFRDIQEAFECLSNPHARRVYESQRPFDDRIPRAGPMDENDFYETYGPVFARNGKFSCKRPVPSLGDESTPYEQVDDFYVFWFHFETWRDFSEYYEFQLEDAEDRDEKRWMAVQNTADGKRMLKKEKKRIRQLTEQAFSIDPRLRRREQQRKEAREKAVEERRLKKEKAKREKEEAEAERKRIEEKELKEKKAITKKLDKRAKNARRKIRKSVTAALEDSEVQDQDLIACAGSDDNVALLTKNLPLESMEQLVEEFQTNGNMAGLTKFQQLVDELNQDKQEAVEKIEQAKPQSKAEKIISNEDNWSIEEMGKFAKAIRKYPGGSQNRYLAIANYMGTRSEDEVIEKYRSFRGAEMTKMLNQVKESSSSFERFATTKKNKHQDKIALMTERQADIDRLNNDKLVRLQQEGVLESTSTADISSSTTSTTTTSPSSESKKSKSKSKKSKSKKSKSKESSSESSSESTDSTSSTDTTTTTTSSSSSSSSTTETTTTSSSSSDDWTTDQLQAFQAALQTHKGVKNQKEKWIAIAADVPGKKPSECVNKFKALAAAKKAKKQKEAK